MVVFVFVFVASQCQRDGVFGGIAGIVGRIGFYQAQVVVGR